MRVVALTCSNTEIVCALGCADALVGVDDYSDYPEEVVAALPRVGPDLGIDIDRVAALEPDLVLASLTVPGHERVVAGLQRAGLPHMAPEPVSLADTYGDIQAIARRLGVESRGEALVASMRAEIPGAVVTDSGGPRILVEWWPRPVIVPGRHSWVTDLIAAAGGVNPIAGDDVKSRPIEDHEIATLAPDAVVISWCGVDPGKYRPEKVYARERWQDLPALRKRRVHCVPEAYLGRPGPRLVEGYRALRRICEEIQ